MDVIDLPLNRIRQTLTVPKEMSHAALQKILLQAEKRASVNDAVEDLNDCNSPQPKAEVLGRLLSS